MAIPKTIHYCWFGGNPLPLEARRFIDTWKKYCPDYTIKEWNETNFDIHCCKYVEQAYQAKKWAFVSDYARFYALYNEGGIYFDTDIEVLKSFDDLLENGAFFGFGWQTLTLPVFGASRGLECYKKILDYYNTRSFVKLDGSYDTSPIENTALKILTEQYGLVLNGQYQLLRENIAIYPREYFCSTKWDTGQIYRTPQLYVIHYADASWLDEKERAKLIVRKKMISIFGKTIGSRIGMVIGYIKTEGFRSFVDKVYQRITIKIAPSLMRIVSIICIKKKKVVFNNFAGRGYGDNPKYIAEELLSRNLNYDLVWIVRKGSHFEFPMGIRTVTSGGVKELFELASAKFWVDNNRKSASVYKSPKQKYIQTWHGFYPLKKMEKDALESLPPGYAESAIHDGRMTDLMVSGCKARTQIYKTSFWYEGEIKEWGTPRNDVFFKDINYRKKVGTFFGIASNKKLLLYAPTFRDDHSIDAYDIDLKRTLQKLSLRFGEEWCVLVRLHPAVREKSSEFVKYDSNIIDASAYDDIQELFAACDFLISDYSDCMFEFSLTHKPVLLYASDLEAYTHGRSFYYDIHDLPYQIAESNDELYSLIENFNEAEYKNRLEMFFDKIGVFEKGTASKSVVDYIIENT